MIHLDTSFLLNALVPGTPEDGQLRAWLEASEEIGMCTIAWAEFLCGPVTALERDLATRLITDRTPFVEEHAELSAELFNLTGRRRGSFADCMIAAAAVHAGASLATTNIEDFERLTQHGLQLAGHR